MTVYELIIFSYQCFLDIIQLLGVLLDNFNSYHLYFYMAFLCITLKTKVDFLKSLLSHKIRDLYWGNELMVINEWRSGEIKVLSPLIYYLCTTVVHVDRYIISCTYTSLQTL